VEPRKKFLAKRAVAALMFAIVAVQVAPSIADVLSGNPEPETSASPTAAPSASPSVEASPSGTPEASPSPSAPAVPSASVTYLSASPSESATAEPALADDQDIVLRIPGNFPVDPRATSVRVSPINVYSSGEVLLCLSTSGSRFWLSNTNDEIELVGNNTSQLILSGKSSAINYLLNSGQGLRVGGNPRVQGALITSRAAVVTKPTLNTELCKAAPKVITSAVNALGLGMNTIKNPVPIK
jgi:hypothetical protein